MGGKARTQTGFPRETDANIAMAATFNSPPSERREAGFRLVKSTGGHDALPSRIKITTTRNVKACFRGPAQQILEVASFTAPEALGLKYVILYMPIERPEIQAAEQAPAAGDEVNDAGCRTDLSLLALFAIVVAASNAGSPHHPALAACTQCQRSPNKVPPCCQCCPVR